MEAMLERLLTVDLPAVPESAPLARGAVLEALAGVAVDRDAVGVVVSEAVANAIMHAYRDQEEPGRVRVSVGVGAESLELAVDDDGLGMSPRVDSPGAGLGVPLMAGFADEVTVECSHGTRVRARFLLFGPAGPHGRPVRRHASGPAGRGSFATAG
jgi:anti-sigma regulatory factor (Ser/Thr protein kinase)